MLSVLKDFFWKIDSVEISMGLGKEEFVAKYYKISSHGNDLLDKQYKICLPASQTNGTINRFASSILIKPKKIRNKLLENPIYLIVVSTSSFSQNQIKSVWLCFAYLVDSDLNLYCICWPLNCFARKIFWFLMDIWKIFPTQNNKII